MSGPSLNLHIKLKHPQEEENQLQSMASLNGGLKRTRGRPRKFGENLHYTQASHQNFDPKPELFFTK